jgi:hypothetical protein
MTADPVPGAAPGQIRIEVTLSVPPGSESLLESVAWLAGLPQHDPDRCELEAQVYMMLARLAWRDADRARELRARLARRKAAR